MDRDDAIAALEARIAEYMNVIKRGVDANVQQQERIEQLEAALVEIMRRLPRGSYAAEVAEKALTGSELARKAIEAHPALGAKP